MNKKQKSLTNKGFSLVELDHRYCYHGSTGWCTGTSVLKVC